MADQSPFDRLPNDPEFFKQLQRILEQLGLKIGNTDLSGFLAQMQSQMGRPPFLGMIPADQDPDAAWLTTITAAKHGLPTFGPDLAPTAKQRQDVADAGRLVDSWLDEHIGFGSLGLEATCWTREQWLDATGPAWRRITEPIITRSAEALGETFMPQEPELAQLQQLFAPMLRSSATMIYRDRLKQTLAKLAASLLSGSEIGIPVLPRPLVTLLPSSIQQYTEGLDTPAQEVLLYLAVRETARQRLFAGVGWLGPQLTALVEHFAREIKIDLDFVTNQFDFETAEELTLEKIAEVGQSLTGSFFEPASTETQVQILGRLETLIALVEGWVDEVSHRTISPWLPNGTALVEQMRRRRAASGPAETIFVNLLGLELRPRRIRDAENLWAALTTDRGAMARDQVWGHPDMVPTSDDLDDPVGFVSGDSHPSEPDDMDQALARLLRQAREEGEQGT